MATKSRPTDKRQDPAPAPSAVQPDEFRRLPFERRSFAITKISHRAEGSTRVLEGHAAVFGVRTKLYDDLDEQIARGCFAETIQRDDIRALINHDANLILGRVKSRNLELAEDAVGLAFRVQLGNQSYARDIAESIDRGDVDQCSFGFQTEADSFDRSVGPDGSKTVVRTLNKCTLFDVGPVTFPAYPTTDVKARSSRLGGVPFREVIEARARLVECPDDQEAADLIRRAIQDLATVAGPTPQERMRMRQRQLDLAARAI